MIIGRFETFSQRPIIDCYISIPLFGVMGVVPFLMDTGADRTLLMPGDALRLGLDHSQLIFNETATGLGGECMEHVAVAALAVANEETKTVYEYGFDLGVAQPSKGLEGVPSILGADIMKNWKITFDYSDNRIEVCVRHWHEKKSIP